MTNMYSFVSAKRCPGPAQNRFGFRHWSLNMREGFASLCSLRSADIAFTVPQNRLQLFDVGIAGLMSVASISQRILEGGGALILVEKGSPPTSKQIAAGDNSTSSIADVRSSSMLTFQSFQYTFHALASDNNKRQNWNKWSTYRKRRSEEQASRCLIENDGKEAIDLLH